MPIPVPQHDTVLGLIDVMKSAFGFGAAAVPTTLFYLNKRKKQTTWLAHHLADEVQAIRAQVKLVVDELGKLQTQTAIHTDKINDSNTRIATLTGKIDEIEHLLPELENVMKGVKSYFERAKKAATPLQEKPLPGGMVAIKKREGDQG